MSLALSSPAVGRTTRMTALVSDAEAAEIAQHAAAAGLSVSAYLRDCALGGPARGDDGDKAALRQVDALIARMEAELDGAIAALSATLARIEPT